MKTRTKKESSQPKDGNPVVFEVITEDGDTIEMEAVCPICDHKGFWMSEDREVLHCAKCGSYLARRKMDVLPEWEIKWEL